MVFFLFFVYCFSFVLINFLFLQYDLNTKKTFLRRTRCDGVESKDFFIGGMVNIFSRNIKLTNYADAVTKDKLSTVLMKCVI